MSRLWILSGHRPPLQCLSRLNGVPTCRTSERPLQLHRDFPVVCGVAGTERALQAEGLAEKRRCQIAVWSREVRMVEWIDRVNAQGEALFVRRRTFRHFLFH